MRIFIVFTLLAFSLASWALPVDQWLSYPNELPHYDYSGDKLKEAWPMLTQGTQQEFPDEAFITGMGQKYPDLHNYMLNLAKDEQAHPAIKALAEGDAAPLAKEIQEVWRLHYQGQYKDAYQLGMQLGAAGAVPAIYSKLMYATFMVTDPTEKLAMFREAAAQSEDLLPLTPGYDFAEFGLLYARVRILERLNTTAALATGFLGSTQKSLRTFVERNPHNSLYPTTLGGIQAGVVERVGSMIGRVTYGATANRTIERFEQALNLEGNLPVIYNEYIVALSRISSKKHQNKIQTLAAKCATLTPFSAEEALNQALCASEYQEQQVVAID